MTLDELGAQLKDIYKEQFDLKFKKGFWSIRKSISNKGVKAKRCENKKLLQNEKKAEI